MGRTAVTLTGVVGPGTYPLKNLAPMVMLTVSDTPSGYSWGGSVTFPPGGGTPTTDDIGSIVITSLTATRVKGTFSGTLAPGFGSGAPGSLVVTGGEFDIGLP